MKEIKEFDTFNGTDGFIIVDGENQNTPGGKLKIPNYANADEGAVLTKTSDDIVWQVPQGGTSLPDTPNDYDSKNYVLGFNKSTGKLAWQQLSNGSGGTLPYA